mmetsp:Transcript_24855/g.59030  ORF Transcript_24855/g.59030 Transcript_24855/m.59030 type:complete len:251 (-) Transcript_24855:242-994(-)
MRSERTSASASPMAMVAVELAEGARRLWSNSSCLPTSSVTSQRRPSPLRRAATIPIVFAPSRFTMSATSSTSSVSPLFESKITTSPLPTTPRSPCSASAACMKRAAVPVEESDAAIFLPTCPDLPNPVTMTRAAGGRCSMQSMAASKLSSTVAASLSSARISPRITATAFRCAGACLGFSFAGSGRLLRATVVRSSSARMLVAGIGEGIAARRRAVESPARGVVGLRMKALRLVPLVPSLTVGRTLHAIP